MGGAAGGPTAVCFCSTHFRLCGRVKFVLAGCLSFLQHLVHAWSVFVHGSECSSVLRQSAVGASLLVGGQARVSGSK